MLERGPEEQEQPQQQGERLWGGVIEEGREQAGEQVGLHGCCAGVLMCLCRASSCGCSCTPARMHAAPCGKQPLPPASHPAPAAVDKQQEWPSPYQNALKGCTSLACLKEAARQPRYRGQFLFPHFIIIGWQVGLGFRLRQVRGCGKRGGVAGTAAAAYCVCPTSVFAPIDAMQPAAEVCHDFSVSPPQEALPRADTCGEGGVGSATGCPRRSDDAFGLSWLFV